jgi:hypothetical protein
MGAALAKCAPSAFSRRIGAAAVAIAMQPGWRRCNHFTMCVNRIIFARDTERGIQRLNLGRAQVALTRKEDTMHPAIAAFVAISAMMSLWFAIWGLENRRSTNS